MRIAMTLLTLSLAFGCGSKKKDKEGIDKVGSGSSITMGSSDQGSSAMGSGSAAGSGSANTMAGSGSDTGSNAGSDAAPAMAHRTGNCPSTVFGSTSKAEVKDGKILVSITSDDKDAIAAIQKRTEELLKEKTDQMAGVGSGSAHDQKGTHGGGMGICPVHVPDGGKATSKKEAKGVTVTITPKDAKDAEPLKIEIEARIGKAAAWVKANVKPGDKGNAGGVGGGKGDDGSNHSGKGDGKGQERKKGGDGKGTGGGGGDGTGGGGGKGKGGGSGKGK